MNTIAVTDIKSLTIAELERLISQYPWFAYARHELFMRLAENGKDFTHQQLKGSSAFLPAREKIYYKAVESSELEDIPVIDFNEINRELSEVAGKPQYEAQSVINEPRYIVIGGDYFSKEDLDSIKEEQSLNIGRFGSVTEKEDINNEEIEREERVEDFDGFYTETLARIYAQQGYYEEAMRVYAKLILLYPEKSAYFATLVNEVKLKNN